MRTTTPRRSLSKRLLALSGLLTLLAPAGCLEVLSIDYRPANPFKGRGRVQVAQFEYVPAQPQRLRPRQVETNPKTPGELLLSEPVGAFFTEAVRRELAHSGYQVGEEPERVLGGVIERFYLDWGHTEEQTVEVRVAFVLRSRGTTVFSHTCRSVSKRTRAPLNDAVLITEAVKECIHQLLGAAQAAHALCSAATG
ncbi:MAG: hypothetical protein ACREIS_10065 [Nitrospiraceae bacterium]